MRAALLLLIAACGDNLVVRDPDVALGGSRLRVIYHLYDDGTRQLEPTHLHDAERDERCAPQTWSDGARYCTPHALPAVFTDSGCGTLLGSVITASPPIVPAYFRREYILHGEALTSRLYEPRERVAAPAQVWQLRDNLCLGPMAADPFHDYYALGPELTSAAFARVRREVIETPSRLAPSLDTSADGMQRPVTATLHDRELDVECTLTALPGDEHATCVPPAITARYYSDAACTEAALSVARTAPAPAYAVSTDPATSCSTYAGVGAELGVPPLYRMTGAGCREAVPPGDERFFAVGAPLSLATVARAQAPEAGHRLAHIELVNGEHRIADARLFDSGLGVECARTLTQDGDRCLPVSTLSAEREPIFRDAACTAPLALVLVPSSGCGAAPTHVVDASAAGVEVRALAPYLGPIFHLSTGDRCLPYAVSGARIAHELGALIPLATFPGATAIIE